MNEFSVTYSKFKDGTPALRIDGTLVHKEDAEAFVVILEALKVLLVKEEKDAQS